MSQTARFLKFSISTRRQNITNPASMDSVRAVNMKQILHQSTKLYALAGKHRTYHELSYTNPGDPMEALSYCHESQRGSLPETSSQIEVQMLHVPWNPADVNSVQGKYASPYIGSAISPTSCESLYFPGRSVAGSEGWGVVRSGTPSSIPDGSLVVIGKPGLGTLRSSLWVSESDVVIVPIDILEKLGHSGSTLFQLGGTALRMLTDFIPLQAGDLVIQNAGNSGVGIMTSQLAKAMYGSHSISIVRRGSRSIDQTDEMMDYLIETGKNTMVILEEDLEDADYQREIQSRLRQLSASGDLPKLALNAVGGESARCMLRMLDNGGTMVTYGGMSARPSVTVAAPQLIFKDYRILGYWHSRWMVNHPLPVKQTMIDNLLQCVSNKGVVVPPCEVFPLKDVVEALSWQASQGGGIRRKLVFDCSPT